MSNEIEFLEHLGRNPAGSPANVGNERSKYMMSPESRVSFDRDIEALRKTFEGRQAMRCLIATPD